MWNKKKQRGTEENRKLKAKRWILECYKKERSPFVDLKNSSK